MLSIRHVVVLAFLMVLLGRLGYSQTLPLTNYTIQNGLPEATVYAVYPDRAGYIWAGTQGGVCSFDGRQFKVLDSQLGLSDNHVTAISSLPDGRLVFGHRSGDITLYSNQIDQLIKLNIHNNKLVNDLLQVGNTLFVSTLGNGVFCINTAGKSFTVKHLNVKTHLPSDTVNNICVKSDHEVWVSTSRGVAVIDTKSLVVNTPSMPAALKQPVTTIYQTADNTLWVGTDRGVLIFARGKLEANPQLINTAAGLLNDHINKVFQDHRGTVWLATYNGIARISNGVIKCFAKANGLLSQAVYDIKEDQEHNLWIAQDDGISCYKDLPFELYTQQDGLIYNEVYKTIEDSEGNFWIATSQGLTFYKAEKNGKQVRNFTTKDGLADNFIYDVFEDSRKNIWIACVNEGVSVYNPATKKITSYTTANGLAGREVISINEDKEGRIWLATLDSGVTMFEYKTRHFTNYTANKGFPANAVWTIHRDRKGTLWFGSREKGLIYLDMATGKFVIAPGQQKMFNHNFGSISSDAYGNIWVASIGDGIFKYNGKTFTQYGIRQGIKSNNPYFIFCDRQGRIWLGTNVGIDLFNPITLTTKNFGKNDGFIGIETNQNAIYQSKDNDLWIGTVNGLMRYRSNSDFSNLVAPKVYITKKYLAFDGTPLKSNKLKYDQNYINFDFLGISLSNADKLRYSYSLVGFSKKWSPQLAESRVSYANLPPGNYSFMVKAGYTGGNWSKPVAFNFTITPPIYKTWWFIMLSAFLISYLVSVIYRYRVNQLLKLERVRNKIATDLHDDIGSALSSISIFSEVADKQLAQDTYNHKTREILAHISLYSRNMLDAMDDIVWAVNPKNDHFKDLAVRMREFAIPLLEARKINFDIAITADLKETKVAMETRKNMFLIFKECINNILKHSSCTDMYAYIKKQNNKLEFVIHDNGKGFDTSCQTSRNGLVNIRKRVEEINGTVDVISAEGKGTTITLVLNTI